MFYKFTTNHLDIALIGHTEQKVNSLQDNMYLMYFQSKCIQYTLSNKDKCTIHLYYIVKKNRFIHLLLLKGQRKSKRES